MKCNGEYWGVIYFYNGDKCLIRRGEACEPAIVLCYVCYN